MKYSLEKCNEKSQIRIFYIFLHVISLREKILLQPNVDTARAPAIVNFSAIKVGIGSRNGAAIFSPLLIKTLNS